MELSEAAMWALVQNYHLDMSNAAVHCAPVRYSPLTFRLAEALDGDDYGLDDVDLRVIHNVLRDRGAYPEDPGR